MPHRAPHRTSTFSIEIESNVILLCEMVYRDVVYTAALYSHHPTSFGSGSAFRFFIRHRALFIAFYNLYAIFVVPTPFSFPFFLSFTSFRLKVTRERSKCKYIAADKMKRRKAKKKNQNERIEEKEEKAMA